MIKIATFDTPLGEMTAAAIREGICFLGFSGTKELSHALHSLSEHYGMPSRKGSNWHTWTLKRQLKEYFRGRRKEFTVRLLTQGTEFQQSVWESLKKIPYGTTITYLEQAKILNNPDAFRAVANADGHNPVAIVIPCHRVIGSDGSLTGYAGGLEKKQWLIDHERKHSGKPVDGTLF